ncbi:MAG: hypothetical protein D6689_14550 [Deltaproteobacteria bacterium]|nr:MAG: hypothetical protein D6689_14550 [Deltaproteobacteria bacterium]
MKRVSWLLVLFGMLPYRLASADDVEVCVDVVQREYARRLMDVSLAMRARTASKRAQFVALRGAVWRFEALAGEADVRACEARSPIAARRFAALREQAADDLARARARLAKLCVRTATTEIERRKLRIDAALARGRLAEASREADALDEAIASDPVIAQCDAAAERIEAVRAEYLAGVRAQVALPRVLRTLADDYSEIARTWDAARAALATSGRTIRPVPEALVGEDGQRAFAERVARCRTGARAAVELGARGDTPVADTTVAAAADLCAEVESAVDRLFARAVAHNARYAEVQRKRWEYRNLRGWDMQKLYQERGRPLAVDIAANDAVFWTFREGDSCVRYWFSPRGKLRGHKPAECPADEPAHVARR